MTNYYINRKLSLATSVATPLVYFLYYYANGLADFAVTNFSLMVIITCLITVGQFVIDSLLEWAESMNFSAIPLLRWL